MNLIELKDITKTYDIGSVKVEALKGVSLQVKNNEYISIMGPSGSGKSTLMSILGCLDTPSYGSYFLDGLQVISIDQNNRNRIVPDDQLALIRNRKIGFIFQSFNLLPRISALQNVELPLIYADVPRKRRVEMASNALTRVNLARRMHHKPSELSGGERQRVACARALVNQPSIILADEPTGNLDTKTSHEIMDLLDLLHQKGNTIILVTHEDDIGLRAKRTIILRDGQIEVDRLNGAVA